jgi:hypothetical protein
MVVDGVKVCFKMVGNMTSDDIIARLGGTVAVAQLCDTTPQAVSQWMGVYPKGHERAGQPRKIPDARLMYLKAIRPDVFVERRKNCAKARAA